MALQITDFGYTSSLARRHFVRHFVRHANHERQPQHRTPLAARTIETARGSLLQRHSKMFEQMMADGTMPGPSKLYHLQRWDRHAVDRALDRIFNTEPSADDEVIEFNAGSIADRANVTPASGLNDESAYTSSFDVADVEFSTLYAQFRGLQERSFLEMYEHRHDKSFRARACGPKTYAALAGLGLVEMVKGQNEPGSMPSYRLTKYGIETAAHFKMRRWGLFGR